MSKSLKQAFALIGLFFALLFAAVAITLQLAFAGFEPSLDDSYYRRGLDYQERVNRLERGRKAGWELSLRLPPEPVPMGPVVIEAMLAGSGAKEEQPELQLRLERPASTRGRQSVIVRGRRVGNALRFRAEMPVRAPGTWELYAEVGSRQLALDQRIRFEVQAGRN